ncbi:ISNCY family transposase [Leptospira interrogans]|uniref:ISNCY family transposase n=1 Tax=Leptospira interrogans TaxID=173 RepID=UPI0007730B20|nr:ISNCY family transposase [Leptospira interrogans]
MIKVFRERYRYATKKEKTSILNEFVSLSGFNRNYASQVLRKKEVLKKKLSTKPKAQNQRTVYYDASVRKVLEDLWKLLDHICSKRLVHAIPETIKNLERFQTYKISKEIKQKLLKISASTIERLLVPIRKKKKLGIKGTSMTKQNKYLIDRIPIKTFGEWKDSLPGFTQIDLIAHNGGNVFGGFFSTLCATDVCTGWTICILVRDKTMLQMLKALIRLKNVFPYPLLGIHSDNGSEFINESIIRFSEKYHLIFTRGRPYKKNDNPHVEQKNFLVVRRNTGYLRFDKSEQFEILVKLYSLLNLYNNFFLPVMMLKEKHRIGSKSMRKYDIPKTPLQRVLKRSEIPSVNKLEIKSIYKNLDLSTIKNEINQLQDDLIKIAAPIRSPNVKVRKRRKKAIYHTTPKWRREFSPTSSNPFLQRQKMQELRRAAETVWNRQK